MPLYDSYEPFRDPTLTEAERARLAEARSALEAGNFTLDPVVSAHMAIAMDRARAQLAGPLVLPEDVEPGIRYPGVDPAGKYSIIDMKFAQREAAIRSALESRSDDVPSHVRGLLDRCTAPGNGNPFHTCYAQMKMAAEQHRTLTRASKLCLDPEGRKLLHRQARALEADPRVVSFDMLAQGLEYAAGLRQGPVPEEIQGFFRQELRFPLPAIPARADRQVEEVKVDFQDPENGMLLRARANPHNWGKSWEEIEQASVSSVNLDAYASQLPSYAAATAERYLNPMFQGVERESQGGVNRCDLIAIDGKTVRETMEEQFAASGRAGSFEDFFHQHGARMANELVAAGLMAGKRVEAFIPDKYGEVPKEPVAVTKTGFEPSPLKPEKFNIWERFFAKRGFYKEKVARQAEYDKIMAARERMRTNAKQAVRARLGRLQDAVQRSSQYDVIQHKALFFDEIMEEYGLKTVTTGADGRTETKYRWGEMDKRLKDHTEPKLDAAFFGFGRAEAAGACVGYLAAQGYKFQDILDPNKLQKERHDIARLYMEKAVQNDAEWLGQVFYNGHKALTRQFQEVTRGVDLRDENQRLAVLPLAQGIIRTTFQTSQFLGKGVNCYKGYALEAMKDAGNDVNRANDLAHDMAASIASTSDSLNALMNEVRTQLDLADPAKAVNAQSVAVSLGTARMILQTMGNGPSMIKNFPPRAVLNEYTDACGKSTSELKTALETAIAPDKRAATAWNAASGKLTDDLRVTDFHAELSIDPRTGKPFAPRKDDVWRLRRDRDGAFSVEVTKENTAPLRDVEMKFQLGSALGGPEPQRQAPQRQTPQPQKKAPQAGGMAR